MMYYVGMALVIFGIAMVVKNTIQMYK